MSISKRPLGDARPQRWALGDLRHLRCMWSHAQLVAADAACGEQETVPPKILELGDRANKKWGIVWPSYDS